MLSLGTYVVMFSCLLGGRAHRTVRITNGTGVLIIPALIMLAYCFFSLSYAHFTGPRARL